MNTSNRPLWQLMLALTQLDPATLTCSECLTVLEQLATWAATDQLDEASLLTLSGRLTAVCPGCQQTFTSRLNALEAQDNSNRMD